MMEDERRTNYIVYLFNTNSISAVQPNANRVGIVFIPCYVKSTFVVDNAGAVWADNGEGSGELEE